MNTLLPEPMTSTTDQASQRLRTTMAAIRLAFTWLGVRKTLSNEQKSQAADTFGATLREALEQTNHTLSLLKYQKKQSRLVQSTLASLK